MYASSPRASPRAPDAKYTYVAYKGISYRGAIHGGFILGAEARYVAAFGIRDNDKIINRCPLQAEPPRGEPRDISRLEMGFERHALQGACSISCGYWIRAVLSPGYEFLTVQVFLKKNFDRAR